MFVHKLVGSWLKHPFWKSRFLLDDPALLADLRASGVEGVIIDVTKGASPGAKPATAARQPIAARLRTRAAPAPAPAMTAARPSPALGRAVDLRSTAPQSMAREFGMASRVADKSRKVVSRIFLESRLGKGIDASQVEPVIEDIFASVQRNPHTFNGLMRCKRDNEYVYRHALAVSALMIALGRTMKLPPDQIRDAGMAGLLMDVGIGHLPVDLTEYGGDYRNLPPQIMREHVRLGHELLEAGGNVPQAVLDVTLRHHEALDGTGYPTGLGAEQIDTLSRMAAICDTYDSMVSDTFEGTGMDPASALQQMNFMRGWFDADIVKAFAQTMGIYPIGSVLVLGSQRLALVVAQASTDPTRPRVRTFYNIAERRLIPSQDIELSKTPDESIVGTGVPEDFDIEDFPRLREKLFATAVKSAR
jgi:HD-GYP domain-containing protein (c-di-GMP phosphodiesterase class II)